MALYQGRTHQLWRVDITDESGRLVAHGELRLQNIAATPPAGTPNGRPRQRPDPTTGRSPRGPHDISRTE